MRRADTSRLTKTNDYSLEYSLVERVTVLVVVIVPTTNSRLVVVRVFITDTRHFTLPLPLYALAVLHILHSQMNHSL